ncbi:PAS domain S-box protein [uncultured Roseovarius sp.]|uniref:PAS domain S-box protein n=1 Tax=uncultured Roseovarius sp. TaxID=293344 RepID=UPI00260F8457|nr:PAS domain S-box protein [uncultured Roseovarius sp.]
MSKLSSLTPEMVETLDICPTVILIFEIETFKIVAANDAAARKYGHSKPELTAMSIMDLRPSDEIPRIARLASRMKDGPDAAGRSRHLTKDGEEFIAEVITQMVEMNGRPCKLAMIHDVTRQAEQEDATQALLGQAFARARAADTTALHFASLFNIAPGRCAIVEPEGFEVIAVNDAYLQSIGKQRAEVIGHPLLDVASDLTTGGDQSPLENLRASLQEAATTGDHQVMKTTGLAYVMPLSGDDIMREPDWTVVNMPLKRPDGSVQFILQSLSPSLDTDDYDSTGKAAIDMPGHLKAGLTSHENAVLWRQLADREALFRTTERLLGVHVWRLDLDKKQLEWSGELFEVFGLPLGSRAPTFDEYVAMVHPDDRDAMLANFNAFFESADQDFTFAHRIVRPNGGVVHIKGGADRILVNGRTLLSGVVQDVTQEVEASAQAGRREYLMSVAGEIGRIGGWRVDLESETVEWSREVARIHEAPETRELGFQRAVAFFSPEYRDLIIERFNACVETGTPFDEVMQIITTRGNRVWIRSLGAPERDATTGRIVGVQGALQDLTEFVRLDAERNALRDRLSRTLESMEDGFFLLCQNWKFTYVNHQCEKLLGRTRQELLGKVIWSAFPEAVGSRFETEYRHAVETGETVEFTEFFSPLEAWFRVTAHPSADGLAVYFRDVTRERIRDQNLRMLNATVARMDDMLLITEAGPIDAPDGPRITYVNTAFETLTGYNATDVIGMTPRFLQGPETDRAELDRIRSALKRQKPVRAEVINYARDGSKYWVEIHITPLTDAAGKTTHFVALQRDISERRAAEQNLRMSEERFRLTTEASKDVIWDWDIQSGDIWWSDKLLSVFGHDVEKSPLLLSDITGFIHAGDEKRVKAGLDKVVHGNENDWHDEYRFIRADGRTAHVVDRAFVLRDENGQALRMIGSMTDVTRERQTEAILRQSQKLDAIGQLTGGVAHDFNNLLTVMLNNGDFLVENLTDRKDLSKMAEQIVGAAERGAQLTSRLLAFARRQPLSPEVTDLNVTTQSLEPLLRRSLGESCEIEIVLADDLWLVEVDPSQFEAALLNLSINARDAMPTGGKLTIETMNTWIDSEGASLVDIEEGQYAVVAVTDTGAGMPPETIERVLEPFFTTKTQGSGLGLPMVYGFTKQSRGNLKIYSEVGEGTTVKLYFPQSESEVAEVSSEIDMPILPRGLGEHILVVEDDPHVRRNVVKMIEGLGYRVTEAMNAARALELLDVSDDIVMLFTDIVMPGGMNGSELATAALQRRPDLCVLYTSGYTENAIVHQGRLDPGVQLLSKPYRRYDLALKLRTVLSQ